MHAVSKVNVSMPGRTEHYGIAGRLAPMGMAGTVSPAAVCFRFRYHTGKPDAANFSDKFFSLTKTGNPHRIFFIKNFFQDGHRLIIK